MIFRDTKAWVGAQDENGLKRQRKEEEEKGGGGGERGRRKN